MEVLLNIIGFILRNIILINLFFAVLIVFFERRNPTSTWLWLMVLVFLPVLGFLLYLFIGQDLRKEKLFARKEQLDTILADKCSHLPASGRRDCGCQDLVQMQCSNDAPLTSDNTVQLFHDGHDKFSALMDSIKSARRYIHIEYYIFRNDNLGRQIIALLAEKAAAGVEVKLLYDGMGGIRLPRSFFAPLLQAGGLVACFFPPFLPYINIRINYRNHRKICIIDGQEGWVGGFNIGDEYLGKSPRFGYWRDTHMRIQGSAVHSLQWRFLLDWQFASGQENVIDQRYFPQPRHTGTTSLQIVSSGPDSKWPAIRDGYFKMIANARNKVYIHTPYFIPDDSIFAALRVAALAGVDVRLIIPGRQDHPFVWWASLSYIGELLTAGVRCFTYQRGFMHSKMLVADGCVASVGTANLDIRSFQLNFEVNAFIYDHKLCQELEQRFVADLEHCQEITPAMYSRLPASVKIRESVSRLLSPLL